jgi:SAM-dependent methyltransferase
MHPDVYREMASVQDRHWWFVARRQILDRVVASLSLPAGASIIEIGSGPGGNLAMLARHGQLRAMETDPMARELAASLGICPVLPGALPTPHPFADATCDLACLFDVLEHIEDDRAALVAVARLLKPGGRILLTVPAYNWLWSAHDESHHHQRRYQSADTCRNHCRGRAGAHPARLLQHPAVPLIATIRSLQKITGRRGSSDASLPAGWINTLLKQLFALERHLVDKALFPFGTSLLAVLKKPA